MTVYFAPGVEKMVFKVLVFWKVGFFVFYGFLDIVVFCINYALKQYSYYFFIIIWFLIYINLYFTVFTLHSLCQYIVVF